MGIKTCLHIFTFRNCVCPIKLIKHLTFSELDNTLIAQYRSAMQSAFPPIILNSKIMKNCWQKLESYFPSTQLFMIDANDMLIGFMNTIPLFWDRPLAELPNEGWDWLVLKGIHDYEHNITPNYLGGLQIIVTTENQGKKFSKQLITVGKKIKEKLGFQHLIIPIRPIFKQYHPEIKMEEYMKLTKDDKVYDPWIRTHLNSGATIVKVCSDSMQIEGDLDFWESVLHQKITHSGTYIPDGALNPVTIDISKNYGIYREENIWISYQ